MKLFTKLAIPLLCSGMIFFTGYKNVENKKQEIKSVVEILETEKYMDRGDWERKRPVKVLKEKLASAESILEKPGLLRTFYKKDLKNLETTVNKTLSKEHADKLISSAVYHSDLDPEYNFFTELAEKELSVAFYIYEKLNMPEEELKILKWTCLPRKNSNGKRSEDNRRDYAYGLLYFKEGKKMVEDCSYLDAPYLLKKAYNQFIKAGKITFGFEENPYILEQSKKFKKEIKTLWPRAHYSAGKYLHNEGYFNQAEKSFVNAQKLGYDVSEELKKVRYDIKNHPELNKNRTEWITGSAGMTITLTDGKGTVEFHETENLK
ncbi:MAG: hypothetical protein Q8O03_08035 [Nanoarchaeota archaeon]|nr:hypothetical protein [Nanoarchaeota archaeon]